MLTLGIDTCCMAATAAITDENRLVAQTVTNNGKTHSETMLPRIEAMFEAVGMTPSDIELFAVAAGPGSFTGVRIGVSMVKAMAQATKRPCVGVSTLEALAYSSKYFDGVLAPILDARRGQVYNALFDAENGKMTRICEDRALSLDELLKELLKMDEKVLFMGDGIFVFEDEIKKALGERAHFAPVTTAMNLAGAVSALGEEKFKKGEAISYGELVPFYVRLSQAERDLLEKEKK